MLVVLSPAKTMTMDAAARAAAATTPKFVADADALASSLGRLSSSALSSLFGVSSAIGSLNEGRFQNWTKGLDGSHGVAAGVAMDGPAFKALDVRSLSSSEAASASKRIAVLSGMYGLLRIFDGIQPYRLEMGTSGLAKHHVCPDGSDSLYKFWGSRIAQALESELQHSARSIKSAAPVIINAASQEYWRSVEGHLSPSVRVVTVQFPGPSVYAKMARGAIARFVATRALDSPDGLKDFTGASNEWSFDVHASSSDVFVFKRGSSKKNDSATTGKVKVEMRNSAPAMKPVAQAAAAPGKRAAASAKAAAANKSAKPAHPLPALSKTISKASASTKSSATVRKLRSQTKNTKSPNKTRAR